MFQFILNKIFLYVCICVFFSDFNVSKDGILTLTKSVDLDTNNSKANINANVTVGDTKHTSDAKVIINIKYINEYSPKFEQKIYNFSVDENMEGSWQIKVRCFNCYVIQMLLIC